MQIQNLHLDGHTLLRKRIIRILSKTILTNLRYISWSSWVHVLLIVGNFFIKINTCKSEHDALVCAAVLSTPGYKVTGTILVLCPCHGLVQKKWSWWFTKRRKVIIIFLIGDAVYLHAIIDSAMLIMLFYHLLRENTCLELFWLLILAVNIQRTSGSARRSSHWKCR